MVHTATLTYMIQQHEYELFQQFISLEDTIFMKQKQKWYNGRFKDNGINIWSYGVGGKHRGLRLIVLRINFIRLIEQNDRIVVMTESDTLKVENKFNELIQQIVPGLPLFHEWKVNRIDYCVNVRTPYVKEYIKLLQKSDIPANTKMIANEHGNYAFRPGSYYVVSKSRDRRTRKTGSITINFYDKQQELIYQRDHNNDLRITDEVIEQGKDILRLEVQCHRPRTDYLKVKYNMQSKNIHHFLDSYIGYYVLEKAILGVCGGHGDFQRMSSAEKIIDSLQCRNSKKERLKKLLHEISYRSTVSKVKARYYEIGHLRTFRSYIHFLNENNINAVTLPRDMKLPGIPAGEPLESLWSLFHDAYMNEPNQENDDFDIFDVGTFIETLEI